MTEPNISEGSYPYDTHETGPSFPYRMSLQEGHARIDALRGSLNSLLYTGAPETDEARLAEHKVFVQTVATYSTLLVSKLISYDDVIIPPSPNIALRIMILQGLYREVPDLRAQPVLVDTRRSLSRSELATAMRACYEVQPEIYRADIGIQQRMANATLHLWGDIVQANPDGILLGAQEDGWIQEMEDRRRQVFGPDPTQ